MIRILHSVSNMDRAGIETMLMNYYRYMDKSKVQFDFLCNKKKPGAYDDEIKSMGGRIYHTPGLNPAKYPVYLKYMRELFQEHPEYKIVEAHNGALGVYALHAAKVSKIPVRIFHAHGASITKDWKLPIKLVCKACLPTNMTHHFSCGVEAAKCYFGQKVVDENDYVLIPNAIDVARFIYNPKIRNKIRKENNLENKHVVGHVGRFMAQKNHTFLILTAVCAIACVAVVVSFVVPTVAQQFSNIIKSVMIAFGDSSETIENFGGNSSTGLESRMIQLSGITWMLMHNAIFGLGASCHTRGKLSYYI